MMTSTQAQFTPATNLSVGDTVRFHYALSNIDGKLYTGRVIGPVKHSELWGDVVLIEPFVCDYHLPPRHVSLSRIVSIVATAASVVDAAPVKPVEAYGACVVPYVTGQDTLRAILDLSNEATAAELAGRQAEARSISKEHTRLYDAYMKAMKAEADSWKTPLQSTQKADSSPSAPAQVTASEMAETPAPLTQADGDTWLSRMRARELSFAKQAAKQWGIAPSDAPRQPAPVTVKPPRAMTPAEQASHDALQKMIDASRKAN
jgi:hypothetical protein